MNKLAIVFWSGTGNTAAMATSISAAATAAGASCEMLSPLEFSAARAADYTAFAFGCPSMGSEQLEESEYQPMWDEVKPALSGKSIVLFGSYGWGDGEWMRNWESECGAAGITVTQTILCNEAPDDEAEALCAAAGQALAN